MDVENKNPVDIDIKYKLLDKRATPDTHVFGHTNIKSSTLTTTPPSPQPLPISPSTSMEIDNKIKPNDEGNVDDVSIDDDVISISLTDNPNKRKRDHPSFFNTEARIKKEHVDEYIDLEKNVSSQQATYDDNCGFSALALANYNEQRFWNILKDNMIGEIKLWRHRYNAQGLNFNVDNLISNLESPCKEKCWLRMPEHAQVAADTLGCPIVVLDDDVIDKYIYLPLQSTILFWKQAIVLEFKNTNQLVCRKHENLPLLSSIAVLNSKHISICERLKWTTGIENAKRCQLY